VTQSGLDDLHSVLARLAQLRVDGPFPRLGVVGAHRDDADALGPGSAVRASPDRRRVWV
jgi:hypothetical protein